MKKILFLMLVLLFSTNVFALMEAEENTLKEENSIQTRIDSVGTKILNSNALEKRVVFAYDKKEKDGLLKNNKALTKRQIVVYDLNYKAIQTDDELAAFLAREIASSIRSYDGIAKGSLSAVKIKAAPKKYELVFDKLAVDYMVKAGYNPLGLITFINKTCPQTRQDIISNKNLTSKRLAYIYERIYFQYPEFLKENEYINNEYYQNFLLTSQNNRRMLEEKARIKDFNRVLKYE